MIGETAQTSLTVVDTAVVSCVVASVWVCVTVVCEGHVASTVPKTQMETAALSNHLMMAIGG